MVSAAHRVAKVTGARRGLRLVAVEGRAGGAALHVPGYGVIVVANTSVRLLVLPLLVCTKTDLNAVPLFAGPW